MRSHIDQYIKYALILILIYLSFLILKPYISIVFLSMVFAYIAFPVHKRLSKILRNNTLSALILTLGLILIIVIPVGIIGNILRVEATDLYVNYNSASIDTFLTDLNIELSESSQETIKDLTKDLTKYLFTQISKFVLSIPQKFISFIIMLFIFFYSFKDGEKVINSLKNTIPISEEYRKRIEKKFDSTVNSLLYGEIVISILEWFIATIGFYIMGIGSPAILGLLVGLVALLPAIGPTIVWVPLTIFVYFTMGLSSAILVGLFGFLILTILFDTILRAKIFGLKGQIHPVIILIGVLGGLSAFGVIGLVLGPLILVLLDLLIEIYVETK